jgi:hypothetical protein
MDSIEAKQLRQDTRLVQEIAYMCEKAYRRGAQHAAVFKLNEADAAWFRHYDDRITRRSAFMPQEGFAYRGKNLTRREYSRTRSTSAVDRLMMETYDNVPLLRSLIARSGLK